MSSPNWDIQPPAWRFVTYTVSTGGGKVFSKLGGNPSACRSQNDNQFTLQVLRLDLRFAASDHGARFRLQLYYQKSAHAPVVSDDDLNAWRAQLESFHPDIRPTANQPKVEKLPVRSHA
jgi:hypothetical protein